MCGPEGNDALSQPLGHVASERSTCAAIAAKAFRESNNDSECQQKQNKHKTCCDGTKLPNAPPTRQPPPRMQCAGPNPACDLCGGGMHPSEPSHAIHLLCVGSSSCKNCHVVGKEGETPAHLCDPLRCFTRGPCRCPAFVSRSTKSSNRTLLSLGTSVTTKLTTMMAKALF